MQSNCFFVFICFISIVLFVHVNSVLTCLNLTLLFCLTLSLHAPSPCQPMTLHPCSSPICQSLKMYVSCQLVTWLSQHTFYTTLSTEYTSGTGGRVDVILILTELTRAAFRPPSCSPQAVWALQGIAQELSNSNWCTSSPMQPKPAVYSL